MLKFIRDPLWQFVAAIVGIAALYVAMPSKNVPLAQLAIITCSSYNPFPFVKVVGDVTKVTLDGNEIDPRRTVQKFYCFINEGEKAILPSDFVTPLRLKSTKEKNTIIFASKYKNDQVSGELGSKRLPSGAYEFEPQLLNPGEGFTALAITQADVVTESVELRWSADIVGARLVSYASLEEYSAKRATFPVGWINVEVVLQGWQIFVYILMAIALFSGWLLVLQLIGKSLRLTKLESLFLIGNFVFSIASAEILTHILFIERAMAPVNIPILIVHGCLVVVTVWWIKRNQTGHG